MVTTITDKITDAIIEMKNTRTGVIEHKWFEICIYDNSWPDQYDISVKDTSSNNYIYESHIYCKNIIMLHKNVEMILEYLGE